MNLIIETLPTAALTPYARNARTHSPEQVAQIAASIREFGFTNPVLIDAEGGIIAGHGRVMASNRLGLAEVPCIRLAHLTDAQRRAYVIADNQLALNAGWDEALLAVEIGELKDLEFDLDLTGLGMEEIDRLLQLDGDGPGAGPGEGKQDGIDYQEKFAVLVECRDEPEQASIYNRLTAQGLICKVLVN